MTMGRKESKDSKQDVVKYVSDRNYFNPFIVTDSTGHIFLGPSMLFGIVQLDQTIEIMAGSIPVVCKSCKYVWGDNHFSTPHKKVI